MIKQLLRLFGAETKEQKQKRINALIDNDPEIKKLDKKIEEINKRATERMKAYDPDWIELLRKHGVNIK